MPFAVNNGVKIYFEVDGDKKETPLFLIHGYLGSSQTWHQLGYVRKLSKYTTVITVDRRGYGRSDKPHDPKKYSLLEKATDILTIADELGYGEIDVWGFSGGGRIVYTLLNDFSNTIRKAIIGGMSPYILPPEYDMKKRIQLLESGMTDVVNNFEEMYGELPQNIRQNLLNNDPLAIKADVTASLNFEGYASSLSFFSTPLFLYVGDKDPFYRGCVTAAEVIPNCQLHILEGFDHYRSLVKTSHIIPHILNFLYKN